MANEQVSTDLGGNIFNFAPPQTQRTPINLDRGGEDPHQDSLNQPMQSTRVPTLPNEVNEFGEIGPSQAAGASQKGEQPPNKKGALQDMPRTQLQPKLINPPSKLTRTLDQKGVKAQYMKRKPNAPMSNQLNNF